MFALISARMSDLSPKLASEEVKPARVPLALDRLVARYLAAMENCRRLFFLSHASVIACRESDYLAFEGALPGLMKGVATEDFGSLGSRTQVMLLAMGLAEMRSINVRFLSTLNGVLPVQAGGNREGALEVSGADGAGKRKSPALLAAWIAKRVHGGVRLFPELRSLELLEKLLARQLSGRMDKVNVEPEVTLALVEAEAVQDKDRTGFRFKRVQRRIVWDAGICVDAKLVHCVYASGLAACVELAKALGRAVSRNNPVPDAGLE